MKKRRSVIIMVVILVMTMLSLPAQAIIYEYFPDVPDDSPYAEAVNTLARMGVVKGNENGNYNPDSTITRAEFATILCRLSGVEDEALAIKTSGFRDVSSSHWACGYIAKAAELGLVNGYGNGNFGPSDTLTYEQGLAVMVRYTGLDDAAIASGGWPLGYLTTAEEYGLSKNLSVKAGDILLRKEMAMIIYNTIT